MKGMRREIVRDRVGERINYDQGRVVIIRAPFAQKIRVPLGLARGSSWAFFGPSGAIIKCIQWGASGISKLGLEIGHFWAAAPIGDEVL